MLTPILLWLAGCAAPEVVPTRDGLVGLQYQVLPEGLVVEAVAPGMGAEAAGVVPGDWILAVDGWPADAGSREHILGPVGSTVVLTVGAPLGGEVRDVEIERGLRGQAARPLTSSVEIMNLRNALRGEDPEAAATAARAIDDSVLAAGTTAGQLGATMSRALQERPDVVLAAALALAEQQPEDGFVALMEGHAHVELGAYPQAVEALVRAESLRPPDVWAPDWTGDFGGNPEGRTLLARSLWKTDDKAGAIAVARDLLASRDRPALQQAVGMADLDRGEPWLAALPPVGSMETQLLDGTPWTLEQHKGEVVLLAFWATWCGPCKEELPELDALVQRYAEQGLTALAVSVEEERDRSKVNRFIKQHDLGLPAALDMGMGRRMGVQAIPALRLIGRDGAITYRSEGYGAGAMAALERQVEAALAGGAAVGDVLGTAWSRGTAVLEGFAPLAGTRAVTATPMGALVGVVGGTPVQVEGSAVVSRSEPGPAGSERVVWFDGPVGADLGSHWVGAWLGDGRLRWLLTTPSAVADLAVYGEHLWVATAEALLQVDATGQVVQRHDLGAKALAVGAEGLWAVDGTRRWQVGEAGPVEAGAAPDGWRVTPQGAVATPVVADLVSGRFGPDGAVRVVAARRDGWVVGLDGEGRPAFTLTLSATADLAVQDLDGDGLDELLVAVRDLGVATVDLALP